MGRSQKATQQFGISDSTETFELLLPSFQKEKVFEHKIPGRKKIALKGNFLSRATRATINRRGYARRDDKPSRCPRAIAARDKAEVEHTGEALR